MQGASDNQEICMPGVARSPAASGDVICACRWFDFFNCPMFCSLWVVGIKTRLDFCLWQSSCGDMHPFALHAPFHHLQPVVFGLMEKDLLCAIMTVAVGVDLGFPWGFSF